MKRRTGGAEMTETMSDLALPGPIPVPGREMPTEVADARDSFAKITIDAPADEGAEQAFLASKLHLIRTDPTLHKAERVGPRPARRALRPGGAGAADERERTGPRRGGLRRLLQRIIQERIRPGHLVVLRHRLPDGTRRQC